MHWVRRWSYELTWQDGHTGVRSREVDTVVQLGAVVRWAQANPRVRRWSIKPVDRLVGEPPELCSRGHRLAAYPHRPAQWLPCRRCNGHALYRCPTCSERVIEPAPGPDCGPPPGWAPAPPPRR